MFHINKYGFLNTLISFLGIFLLSSCNTNPSTTSSVKYQDASVHKLVSSEVNAYILNLRQVLESMNFFLLQVYGYEEEIQPFPACEKIVDINNYINAYSIMRTTYDTSMIDNSLAKCISTAQDKGNAALLDSLNMLKIKFTAESSIFEARQLGQTLIDKSNISQPMVTFLFLMDFYTADEIIKLGFFSPDQESAFKDFSASLKDSLCITDNKEDPIAVPELFAENSPLIDDETKELLRLMTLSYCNTHLSLENRFDDQILLNALSPSIENLMNWRLSLAILSQESIEYYQKYFEILKQIITPFNATKIAYRQVSAYDYDIVRSTLCSDKYVTTSWEEGLTNGFNAIFSAWWIDNESPEALISKLDRLEQEYGAKVEISLLKGTMALFNDNPEEALKAYDASMTACIYDPLSLENMNLAMDMFDKKNGKKNLLSFLTNESNLLFPTLENNPSINNIRTYIKGYDQLSESLKKIVAYKIAIWQPFIGDLVDKGLGAFIKSGHIPLYEVSRDLVEFPYHDEGVYGRFYYDEDLRSSGFISGITYGNDIILPLMGSVYKDVLVHEIAHQVELHLFPKHLVQCVDNLYKKARKKNLFVSAYGSTNAREYFAESMTAFTLDGEILNYLLPDAKYNKEFLRINDPNMYQLAESIVSSQGDIDKISCTNKTKADGVLHLVSDLIKGKK